MIPVRADQTIKELNWDPSDFMGGSAIAEKAYFEDRFSLRAKDELNGNKEGSAFTEEYGALGQKLQEQNAKGDVIGAAQTVARGAEVLRRFNYTPDKAAGFLSVQSSGRGARRAQQSSFGSYLLNAVRSQTPGINPDTLRFLAEEGAAVLATYNNLRATGDHTAAERVLNDFVTKAKGMDGVDSSLSMLIPNQKYEVTARELRRALSNTAQFFNSYNPDDPSQRAAIRLMKAQNDNDKLSVIVRAFAEDGPSIMAARNSGNWQNSIDIAKKNAELLAGTNFTLDQVYAHAANMYAGSGKEGELQKQNAIFTLNALRNFDGMKQVSDEVSEFAFVTLPNLLSQYDKLVQSGAYEGMNGAGAVKDNILNFVNRHRDELQTAANYLAEIGQGFDPATKSSVVRGPGIALQSLLTTPDDLFVTDKKITVGDKEMPLATYLAQQNPGTRSSIEITNSGELENLLSGVTGDAAFTARMATQDTPFKGLFSNLVKGYQSSKMVGGAGTGASKNASLGEAGAIGGLLRVATDFTKDRVMIESMGGDEPAARFLNLAIESSKAGPDSRINIIDLKNDAKMYAMARRLYGDSNGDMLDPESFYQFKNNLSKMATKVFTDGQGKPVGTSQQVYNGRLAQAVAFAAIRYAGADAQYTLPAFGSEDFSKKTLDVTKAINDLKQAYGVDILDVPPGASRTRAIGEFAVQLMTGNAKDSPTVRMAEQLGKLRGIVSRSQVAVASEKADGKITQAGSVDTRFEDFEKSNLRSIGQFMYNLYGTDMNLRQFSTELKSNDGLINALAEKMAAEWKKDRNFSGDPKLLEPVAKKFIVSNFVGGDTETKAGMSIGECFRDAAQLGTSAGFSDVRAAIDLAPTAENADRIRAAVSNVRTNLPLSEDQKKTQVVEYLCRLQDACLSGNRRLQNDKESAATNALMTQMLVDDGRITADEKHRFRTNRTAPHYLVTNINQLAEGILNGKINFSKESFNDLFGRVKYLAYMAEDEKKSAEDGTSRGGRIYETLLYAMTNNFFKLAVNNPSITDDQVQKYIAAFVNNLYPGKYSKSFLMSKKNRRAMFAEAHRVVKEYFNSQEAENSLWGKYGTVIKDTKNGLIMFDLTKAIPVIVEKNLADPRINWGTGTPEVDAARSVYMTFGTPNEQLAAYQTKIEQGLRASGFSNTDVKAATQRLIPMVNQILSQPNGIIKADEFVTKAMSRRVFYFPAVNSEGVVTGVDLMYEDENGIENTIKHRIAGLPPDSAGLVPHNKVELMSLQEHYKNLYEQRRSSANKLELDRLKKLNTYQIKAAYNAK